MSVEPQPPDLKEPSPKQPGAGQFGVILRSTAWVSGTRVAVRVLGLVNTAIVARLLTPADYGIVALAMSVWALLEMFTSFDTDTYIVRAKSTTRAMFDAAWTLNLLTGLILGAAIALGAPYLARFLENAQLTNILYIIAAIVLVASLKNPAFLQYNRRQDFSREFLIEISGKVLSVAVTIYFAYTLRSFYALIIGIAFSYTWRTLATYALKPYLPRFSLSHVNDILHFGSWLMAAKILAALSTKLDSIILQKFIGTASVGLYSMARETANIIAEQLVVPVRRALLPAMARVQSDIPELRRLYVESVAAVFAVVAPVALGLALVADDFVRLLLGARWLDAVPLLEIMSAGAVIGLISANYQVVFMALGQTKQFFYRSACFAFIRPAAFVAGALSGGLYGAVWSAFAVGVLMRLIELYLIRRLISLSPLATLSACKRSIAALAAMSVGVLATAPVMPAGGAEGAALLRLAVSAGIGASVYVAVHFVLWYLAGRPLGIESRILDLARRKLALMRGKRH